MRLAELKQACQTLQTLVQEVIDQRTMEFPQNDSN
jgi:hypothetical protein